MAAEVFLLTWQQNFYHTGRKCEVYFSYGPCGYGHLKCFEMSFCSRNVHIRKVSTFHGQSDCEQQETPFGQLYNRTMHMQKVSHWDERPCSVPLKFCQSKTWKRHEKIAYTRIRMFWETKPGISFHKSRTRRLFPLDEFSANVCSVQSSLYSQSRTIHNEV